MKCESMVDKSEGRRKSVQYQLLVSLARLPGALVYIDINLLLSFYSQSMNVSSNASLTNVEGGSVHSNALRHLSKW